MTSSSEPSGSGPGVLARSQVATSSRNPSSDGDSVRSIGQPTYTTPGRTARDICEITGKSDPLDQRTGAQPAPATHRHQPHLLVGALHLVQQAGHQAGAGRPQRVADRDRGAVDVGAVHVGVELAAPG